MNGLTGTFLSKTIIRLFSLREENGRFSPHHLRVSCQCYLEKKYLSKGEKKAALAAPFRYEFLWISRERNVGRAECRVCSIGTMESLILL
jgi:hypothetical protein